MNFAYFNTFTKTFVSLHIISHSYNYMYIMTNNTTDLGSIFILGNFDQLLQQVQPSIKTSLQCSKSKKKEKRKITNKWKQIAYT